MRHLKNSLSIILITLIFTSCRKVIDIDLNSKEPQLVVEAVINDLPGPYTVSLTQTVNFNVNNIFPNIQGAFVTIADNTGAIDTLLETSPGIYKTQHLQGIVGRTYYLNMQANGKTITAQSTMPAKVALDSLTYLVTTFNNPGGGSNAKESYIPIPSFTDPINQVNFYRFARTVNDTLDRVFFIDNDNLINGLKYQRPLFGGEIDINKGDSLLFEMQCIDKRTYEYFNSLNASIGNGPGGSATPANPTTNLVGDALGYFSAHTSERKKVMVK